MHMCDPLPLLDDPGGGPSGGPSRGAILMGRGSDVSASHRCVADAQTRSTWSAPWAAAIVSKSPSCV